MQPVGNFEKLAQSYQAGRRDFDDGVFNFLTQQIGSLENKNILDVGCGTGIATRQLAQLGAKVTGSDVSAGMIAEAQQSSNDIEYVVAPTHKLPFKDESFSVITAFSAFHWFSDSDSITEIKRVLKEDGLFAVVNKNDTAGMRKDINQLFTKYRKTKSAKHDYNPEQILENSGFEKVTTCTITSTEAFTPEEALTYLQSIALWNLVPEVEKEDMLAKVKSFCDNTLRQERILKREIETTVVVGFKK